MPFTTANGVRYAYEIAGRGQPLLLLHGFTGSQANWRPLLPAFTRNFEAITVDILGHGQTGAPDAPERYDMEQCAGDIAAVAEAVAAGPVHLLGYSMGGRLALYLAWSRPEQVRSLILESASPGLEADGERRSRVQRDERLAQRIEGKGVAAFVDYWEQIPLFASQRRLPEPARQALRAQRLQNNATGLANSLRGMGTGRQPSLWPHLPGLDLPVLLLAGALDARYVEVNRRMAGLLPRARLAIVPEAGHTIHLEQPETFSRQVLQFLAGR